MDRIALSLKIKRLTAWPGSALALSAIVAVTGHR
jgi:hypothetical protein